jgi:hypothetical protein
MLQTLDIRHDTTLDAAMRDELSRIAADLERRCPHLPGAIVLPWSDHPVVALDRGDPWLYGPADRDPQLGRDGPGVLPRWQRAQLAEVAATGPRFDAVGVAHELDPGGPVHALLPLLVDGPRTCTDAVAPELVGPVPAHPGVARAAGMVDALVGGDALAWASGALDRLLDPIVFGVVAPYGLHHGAPCVWLALVAWRW